MSSLLIIDDDVTFCKALSDSMARKGYETKVACSSIEAICLTKEFDPEYALVDLNLAGSSGLTLIPKLLAIEPYMKIVVLTGYASIATAVEAIKLGAMHYLAKPVDTAEIIEAFFKIAGDPDTPIQTSALPLEKMKREHITTTLKKNQGNISATARELNMHRRTLQRKLDKYTRHD